MIWIMNSILLGLGLAMDAFTVSLANGLHEPEMKHAKQMRVAGVFAGFQTLMPLLGWLCVHTILQLFSAFEKFIPWIALLLLGFIGGKMLIEGIHARCHPDAEREDKTVGAGALMVQGIATSIDALSVGFTIAAYDALTALLASLIIAAVTFVMGLASAVTWLINLLLVRLNLEYMQTVVFILVIAALVQFVEMFLQKKVPALYTALGIYLPLITTNCAVLGVALLNVQKNYNFLESVVYGVTGGLGFLLAIVLFASVRERLDLTADCPRSFEGFPIALVSAGLLALAFMGFSGLSIG